MCQLANWFQYLQLPILCYTTLFHWISAQLVRSSRAQPKAALGQATSPPELTVPLTIFIPHSILLVLGFWAKHQPFIKKTGNFNRVTCLFYYFSLAFFLLIFVSLPSPFRSLFLLSSFFFLPTIFGLLSGPIYIDGSAAGLVSAGIS